MKISDREIKFERIRMEYEKLHFGKYLKVGTGESEDFWKAIRHKAGNRWYRFWKNKSDYQIMKEDFQTAKRNGDKWGVPEGFNL